jgi:hypothetical protein
MTTKEIIGWLIVIAVLSVDLITDYRLWLKYRNVIKPKGSVNHMVGAGLRIAGLIIAMWFLGWLSIPLILFSYWVFYDGLFNVATGQNFFRIGTTAWLDIQQRRYEIIIWFKYTGFGGFLLLYIFFK